MASLNGSYRPEPDDRVKRSERIGDPQLIIDDLPVLQVL